jgi:hypothetical protein
MAGLFTGTPTWKELADGHAGEGDPALEIVIGQLVAATTPLESFSCTEKLPAAVGVPVTDPLLVISVRPVGSVPTIR